MSSTFAAPAGRGRHRLGRPGLVSVSAFTTIIRRGFFAALVRPGKHRFEHPAAAPTVMVRPAPAT